MDTQFTPVPYNVLFELFIMAKNSDDGVQIVEQILPYFQPEYTITLNQVPSMDINRVVDEVMSMSEAYRDHTFIYNMCGLIIQFVPYQSFLVILLILLEPYLHNLAYQFL